MSQLFVRTGITFDSSQQALAHIGKEMLAKGVVHDSYPQALVEREASFPTALRWSVTPSLSLIARRFMRNHPLSI